MAVAYPSLTPAARVAGVIDPVQPPFPFASYLWFQPEAGIHSSILISESELGFTVNATRQNAGTSLNDAALPFPFAPPPPPAENAPAATDSAAVMVVLGSASELRLSQVAAASGPAAASAAVMPLTEK